METCLILGGNGFIGSHLAERLVERRYCVRVFDKFKNRLSNLENIKDKIEIVDGDFLIETDICNSLKDIDYVFHYISTTVPATAKNDPIFDIETNVRGSVRIFQEAVKNNVKKVIYPSSGGTIYGEPIHLPINENDPTNPIDPYGISKLAIEKYLYYFSYAYGLEYTILRYSNPYGERQDPNGKQGVIPIFLNKIRHGEQPTIYGDGSMIRDYLYVKDAVDATVAILESKTSERVFNIGSGVGVSLNELIETMSRVLGKNIYADYVKPNTSYVQRVVLDISKIQSQIGWKPRTNLEEGIRRTWDWIGASSTW